MVTKQNKNAQDNYYSSKQVMNDLEVSGKIDPFERNVPRHIFKPREKMKIGEWEGT